MDREIKELQQIGRAFLTLLKPLQFSKKYKHHTTEITHILNQLEEYHQHVTNPTTHDLQSLRSQLYVMEKTLPRPHLQYKAHRLHIQKDHLLHATQSLIKDKDQVRICKILLDCDGEVRGSGEWSDAHLQLYLSTKEKLLNYCDQEMMMKHVCSN